LVITGEPRGSGYRKLGHREIQIRTQGVKCGQYPAAGTGRIRQASTRRLIGTHAEQERKGSTTTRGNDTTSTNGQELHKRFQKFNRLNALNSDIFVCTRRSAVRIHSFGSASQQGEGCLAAARRAKADGIASASTSARRASRANAVPLEERSRAEPLQLRPWQSRCAKAHQRKFLLMDTPTGHDQNADQLAYWNGPASQR